jgi:hypothetical protein
MSAFSNWMVVTDVSNSTKLAINLDHVAAIKQAKTGSKVCWASDNTYSNLYVSEDLHDIFRRGAA